MSYVAIIREGIPSLEECRTHADTFAQSVMNAWGEAITAGLADNITPDFKILFETTCRYTDAKKLADNHRQFNALTETDTAHENETCEAFAKAYLTFCEAHKG